MNAFLRSWFADWVRGLAGRPPLPEVCPHCGRVLADDQWHERVSDSDWICRTVIK